MKSFETQEINKIGFIDKLFGEKDTGNALVEINNLLAQAEKASDVTQADIDAAFKKWKAKPDENNISQRSAMFRKVADIVYTEVVSKEDSLFSEIEHVGNILSLSDVLKKSAISAAKKAAYFSRCRHITEGTEPLTLKDINDIFDYEDMDGLEIRIQIFNGYVNTIMEGITEAKSFSPEEEEKLVGIAESLDVPLELKPNIANALKQYRQIWGAKNTALKPLKIDFPLDDGESCYAATQAGLSERKMVEMEENYFELTRRLEIDETINFKGDQIEHPKHEVEAVVIKNVGNIILTNKYVRYSSEEDNIKIPIAELENVDLEVTLLKFSLKNGNEVLIRLSDEASEIFFILLNRVRAELIQ